ncbi:MAG: YbbR-like domain-containing protein [bacterium]
MRFFLDFFTRDSAAKIKMLFLALILWLFVKTEEEYDHSIFVPIEVKGVPENQVLINVPPPQAKVRFSGRGRALLALQFFYHPRLVINLAEHPGQSRWHLTSDMIFLDPSLPISVLEVLEPKEVEITIDRLISSKLPVKVIWGASVEPGWVLGEWKMSPESVLVKGPASLVNKLSWLETQVADLGGRGEIGEVKLKVIKPEHESILITPENVSVNYRMERLTEIIQKGLNIEVKNLPSQVKAIVEPPTGMVHLAGAMSRVAALKPEQVSLWADYREVISRQGWSKVHCSVDTFIKVLKIDPEEVKVVLRVE